MISKAFRGFSMTAWTLTLLVGCSSANREQSDDVAPTPGGDIRTSSSIDEATASFFDSCTAGHYDLDSSGCISFAEAGSCRRLDGTWGEYTALYRRCCADVANRNGILVCSECCE